MPTMANITIKKADNVTDVVYTALTSSAGDAVPAQWRSETAHAVSGFRPVASVVTRWNSRRDGRRIEFDFLYPIVETVNGVDTIVSKLPFKVTALVPTNVSSVKTDEACMQAANFLASTLIRDTFKSGFAPRS